MKFFIYPLLLGLAALNAAGADTKQPVKVLFLVGGLYHNYDQLPRELVQNLQKRLRKLRTSVPIEFTVSKNLGLLRANELSKYDALMMNVCEQTPLQSDQKHGFLNAVRNGMPVIALHCTFWSFQAWPEFKEVLGAFVPGHIHFQTFCLKKADVSSPILKGVPSQFELTDEPYIVNDRDPSMHVLVRTCQALKGLLVPARKQVNRSGPEPEVWTKHYGKGRIFAMTFGHDARAQENPVYLTLLTNGILWSLDRLR